MMAEIASALAYAMLHSLWQCALLAAMAWLTLRAMANARASARHAVALAFQVAMLLAPIAQLLIYANADAPLHDGLFSRWIDARVTAAFAPLAANAWFIGAAVLLTRCAVGRAAIVAMERASYLAPPQAVLDRAESLRRALGIAGTVVVRLSDEVLVPCITHVIRPTIWLPAALVTRIPSDQLEALLAHELAHLARRDWLWSGVQNVVEALLFYHPAVWWLGRQVRQEREHACDDLAVTASGDGVALAEALAGLAEARHAAHVGLAANGGALLRRVTRLLMAPPSRARRRVLAALAAVAMCGALLAGQVSAGGGQAHDLQVEASTAGDLGPGDYRQVVANEHGSTRFYRVSVDARGRVSEVYRVDGRARPIDADVREWLARVTA